MALTDPKLTEEQLRHVISSYLDEIMHYYQDQQRTVFDNSNNDGERRLENRARELLAAMGVSKDPDKRREAILQVMCRAMQRREPELSS